MFADKGRLSAARNRKVRNSLGVALCGLALLSLFQNCAKHEESGGASFSSALCTPFLKPAFEETVYPFTKANCNKCHEAGGKGKQSFADSDPDYAWNQFAVISNPAVKVYNNATSTSHAPGDTGPDLVAQASVVRKALEDGIAICMQSTGGLIPGVSVYTDSKPIGLAVGESKTLVWNLNTELSKDLSTDNTLFFINITASGAGNYQVSNPRVRTGNIAVRFKSLKIIFNGQVVDLATLFTGVDKLVPADTYETELDGILSNSTLTFPATVEPEDIISIGFETIAPSGT
jgi:hypothetical protein